MQCFITFSDSNVNPGFPSPGYVRAGPMKGYSLHILTCCLLLVFFHPFGLIASALAQIPSENELIESLQSELVLKNAQIIDPRTQQIKKGHLKIRNGRIVQSVTEHAPVLDLKGAFVLPGWVDLHVHTWGNPRPDGHSELLWPPTTLKHTLYAGVTSVLDLFFHEDYIFKYRDRQRQRQSERDLPFESDLFAAGPILTCRGGHGTQWNTPTRTIDSPEEAVKEVSELALKNPDVVKLVYDHAFQVPSMDRATLRAAIRTAHYFKLKTVVHIGTWKDFQEAVEEGTDAVTHLEPGSVIPDSLIELLKEKKTYVIPTLAVMTDLALLYEAPKSYFQNPLLQALTTPSLRNAYLLKNKWKRPAVLSVGWQKDLSQKLKTSLKLLAEAQIPLLTGSDTGNWGTFQGYSLHRELELFAAAGVPPWEILQAATTRAGDFLGQPYGVTPGNIANLVVLKKSPLRSIHHSQDILYVIHHGKVIDPKEILE